MNREQLYINNQYIPLSKSINASITKSIADIENPDKRKATYSKSATVPNSPEAQKVFGNIFELNLANGSFDPTVKASVLYLVDGEPILNGYCQLKEIIQRDRWEIEYSLTLFGTISNIFNSMGEEELVDLYDFTESTVTYALKRWNHPFTAEIQEWSWDNQIYDQQVAGLIPFALGQGYVYPLMDYGFSTDLNTWHFDEMSCAIYVKTYIDAIFAKHGYSYTSAFFDSTYFKSLIVPSSPRTFQLDATDIQDREFTSNTPQFQNGTTTSNNLNKLGFSTPEVLKFTNELTDPGGNFDPATGTFTAIYSGLYDFCATLDQVTATFTPSAGSVVTTSSIEGRFEIFLDSTLIASTPFYINYDDYPGSYSVGARTTTASPTIASNQANIEYAKNSSTFWYQVNSPASANILSRDSASIPNRYQVMANNIYVFAGQDVTIRWKAWYRGLDGQPNQSFYNGLTYTGGDATLSIPSASFYCKAVNNQSLSFGNTLRTEKIIPKNIKQKDFFMSLVKMFNLWIDIDPLDENNFLIEPRSDFLSSDIIDISDKLAQNRDLVITPMGKLDATDYIFSYKQDKDYYNDKYEGDWQKIYGNREVTSTNEFTTKKKKIDVIFSPTPLVAPPNSDRVLSTIIELDDLNYPKDVDHNIRILYYGGLKDSVNSWTLTRPLQGWPPINLFDVYAQYPYAGHFDDPYTVTEDINFGLVNEVYYDDNIQTINVTDNNLVNKYYLDMLSSYTSKDSKIVEGWFNVQPSDFKNWTFDKLYYFENSYFRLNKISNYNPTSEDLTKCEFLRLETVPTFTPAFEDAIGDDGPIGGFDPSTGGAINPDEVLPTKGTRTSRNTDSNNTSGRGVKIQGENNIISPSAFFIDIQGDDNQVFDEAENIKIQGGDGNIIDAGVRNVTLINTSNTKIEESNVVYMNGVLVDSGSISAPSAVEEISASQDIGNDVKSYIVDTSGGDVTITFQLAGVTYTEGQVWYLKKDDPANQMIISVNGGTIDGESSIPVNKLNSSVAVIYDGGTKFYII